MPQPARICLRTAFATVEADAYRTGKLVEVDTAEHVASNPSDARIEASFSGRFG
jgi:ABC-type phosphate transport system ATPase subunit